MTKATPPVYPHRGRDPSPLRPPHKYLHTAHHHWVEYVDFDGRGCGLEVYQWQPHAQKWCLPNHFAQGDASNKDLVNYRYVAVCPTPAFKHEADVVRSIFARLKDRFTSVDGNPPQSVPLTVEEYSQLRLFFYEQLCVEDSKV